MACRKKDYDELNLTNTIKTKNATSVIQTGLGAEGCMEFAPQTANPYSVSNMDSALQELIDTGEFECDYNHFNVRATHKYIRFEPQDTLQYDELNDDSTLILFDYPLDRRITKGGTYYRDPNVPEVQPNYQWCCVEYNKTLPSNIPYTNLSDLYLPEQDPELAQYENTDFDGCVFLLVTQAMKRTNNFDTLNDDGNQTSGGSDPTAKKKISFRPPPKWSPKGTIRIYDDVLNQKIGLDGVRVRANRWFETRATLTNSNGFFEIGKHFNHPVDYSIKWERPDFHIRSGTFGQDYFNGPHQKGDWNMDLEKGTNSSWGISWVYGHVHRAAVIYHYGDIDGARRPKENNLRFWIYDKNSPEKTSADAGFEKVRMWRFRNNWNAYNAAELFSIACHEMAHLTHRNAMTGSITFLSVHNRIVESYSDCIEWLMVAKEYRGRGLPNFATPNYTTYGYTPIYRAHQSYNLDLGKDYTPVFIDLIDDFNQSTQSWGGNLCEDDVTGFEMKEIEKRLKNIQSFANFITQMQAIKPSGVTNAQVDDLIEQYD